MSADIATATTLPPTLARPPQSSRSKAPKSPPLAFEKTSNDALAPFINPSYSHQDPNQNSNHIFPLLPIGMGPRSILRDPSNAFQDVVHKQATAIRQLHLAFTAEREAWSCERDALYQRISNLEELLNANNEHSPAKSPTMSPRSGSSITSPSSRAMSAVPLLPTIAEDENIVPLSQRRDGAPVSIEIPSIPTITGTERLRHNSVVGFTNNGSLQVEEIPPPPADITKSLSPPPPANVVLAGHTPMRTPVRPPTPPPKEKLDDGLEDTPTRNNTHINNFLTRYSPGEDDKELTGPLSMPELPNQPGEHNFTEEMLFKRLEQIAMTPDCDESRPMIFAQPSPGMMTPENREGYLDAKVVDNNTEAPLAPISTRDQTAMSATSSNALNSNLISPQAGVPLSQQTSHDHEEDQRNFEHGGIKLKKKPSSNFGAPFGVLGGFGSIRRPS